ncbi:MAG: hypothetical protein AAF514_07515 [Verrucomicrobiota bacterium]
MNRIHIAGGGIAGLALGCALRHRDLPVTLHEAGTYPRHRVCGEFMNGVTLNLLAELGLERLAEKCLPLRKCVWFHDNQPVLHHQLPSPALGLSRFDLDQYLADLFQSRGGELNTGNRVPPDSMKEGWVQATGRHRQPSSPWLGIKIHARNFQTDADLEMHLGRKGYVGVSRLPEKAANVCGLFQVDHLPGGADKQERFLELIERSGLNLLARGLRESSLDSISLTGINAFQTGRQKSAHPSALSLGDAATIIPPFTGNGMTMALEGAALAARSLEPFSRKEQRWAEAKAWFDRERQRRFQSRLRWASAIHPCFFHPWGRQALSFAARNGFLPIHWVLRRLTS